MSSLIAAFVGFSLGLMAFGALVRWVALIFMAWQQAREASGGPAPAKSIALAASQSLFHAGPWSILIAAFVAYQVRSEPWAPWAFAGFALGLILMSGVTAPMIIRAIKAARER